MYFYSAFEIDSGAQRCEGDQPVQRPAIEVVKPQRGGNTLCNRSLSGCRGPVDRNDRWRTNCHTFDPAIPASTSKNAGNVFATHRGSLMRTAMPPAATSAKDIAIRWSS